MNWSSKRRKYCIGEKKKKERGKGYRRKDRQTEKKGQRKEARKGALSK